jgi:hypothetical protein
VVQGRLGQWIGGNEVFGGAETFEVIAPATEERKKERINNNWENKINES